MLNLVELYSTIERECSASAPKVASGFLRVYDFALCIPITRLGDSYRHQLFPYDQYPFGCCHFHVCCAVSERHRGHGREGIVFLCP